MSLYCDDGRMALIPTLMPGPKPERGAPWNPPVLVACDRCGRASWQHRSFPPVFADEIDRAIYAAAIVRAMGAPHASPESGMRAAILAAEELVELHRRARSGA